SGTEIAPHDLADLLVDAGFAREDPVTEHGSFAVRGGIVDVFPAFDPQPVRIEFIGDMVESLRRYDPESQRSVSSTDVVEIGPIRERFDDTGAAGVSAVDYFASLGAAFMVSELDEVRDAASRLRDQLESSYAEAGRRGRLTGHRPDVLFASWSDLAERLERAPRLETLAMDEPAPGVRHVRSSAAAEFHGRVHEWVADLRKARERGDTVVFMAESPGRA